MPLNGRRQEVRGKKTYNDNFFVPFMHSAMLAMLLLLAMCHVFRSCHNKFLGGGGRDVGWRNMEGKKHAPIATDPYNGPADSANWKAE